MAYIVPMMLIICINLSAEKTNIVFSPQVDKLWFFSHLLGVVSDGQ